MTEYDLVSIFKALGDRTRQDILELLGDQELNVSDICARFSISQPTISHHLHILKSCQLIDYRREGKNIYYYAKREIISDVFGNIAERMHIHI